METGGVHLKTTVVRLEKGVERLEYGKWCFDIILEVIDERNKWQNWRIGDWGRVRELETGMVRFETLV